MWITRNVEAELDALLQDESARLVTVFGQGGSGASALVERALRGRARRVDLRLVTRTSQARQLLHEVQGRTIWLDQAHHPRAVRAAAESLSTRARVVVAARAPLESALEHRVALGSWSLAETTELVVAEARRRGMRTIDDAEMLARHADGWPLLARALVVEARLSGPRRIDPGTIHRRADDVRRVLDETWSLLGTAARALLVALAAARGGIEVEEALAGSPAAALERLVDHGLVVTGDGRARVRRAVAAYVDDRPRSPSTDGARRRGESLVLACATRARDDHRRDPAGASMVLARLHDDLVRIARHGSARAAVLAASCLEPLLAAGLSRAEVLSIFQHAAQRAKRVGVAARAGIALALVRTYLHRGEHENAEAILDTTVELSSHPRFAAHRAIYLAHVAAWRGKLDDASRRLDEADVHVAEATARSSATTELAGCLALEEDAMVQRAFVALQRDDLDEADRVARVCAAMATRGPSPRIGAIARRFAGEIFLRRGDPARAASLFEQARDELLHFGDCAGWLFVWSRMVEAMRAASDPRATTEARAVAQIAASAGEGTLELAVLDALRGDDVDGGRVGELAWRAQIPALRDQASRWLAARAPAASAPRLRLDTPARRAWIDDRSVSFARRASLWHMLVALAEAHARVQAMPIAALFAVGWPGERAEAASRRKRVQTAVWTLRRILLGDLLATVPEGYVLDRSVRIDRGGLGDPRSPELRVDSSDAQRPR